MKEMGRTYFERTFLAIQRCAVPASAGFTEAQIQESLDLVKRFLQEMPSLERLKLLLFLIYVDVLSFLSGAGSFSKLNEQKQHRLLQNLFDSNIALIRKGFWGLNTLARLGVYGQPSVYSSLNYRVRPTPHE